jgi:hypothetical protein
MRKLKAFGLSLVVALGAIVLSHPAIFGASQTCTGAFLPSLNCTIPGLWNFTNSAGAFQINGVTAAVTAADLNSIHYKSQALTNANVLALNTTAFTIIPLPASGTIVEPIGGMILFKYAAAYTAGTNLKLWYNNRTSVAASDSITVAGLLTGVTTNIVQEFGGVPTGTNPPTTPTLVALQETANTAFSGGDPGNSVTVQVGYRVHTTGF